MRRRPSLLLAVALATLSPWFCENRALRAGPVYSSDTGHYYELVEGQGFSWSVASTQADSLSYQGMRGHLATIGNQAENDFITNSILSSGTDWEYWIGGYQPSGSPEPGGNWSWIAGEPWAYSNWAPGEPSNTGDIGHEDRLHIRSQRHQSTTGMWNDIRDDDLRGWQGGYVVEYEPVPAPRALPLAGFAGLLLLLRRPRLAA